MRKSVILKLMIFFGFLAFISQATAQELYLEKDFIGLMNDKVIEINEMSAMLVVKTIIITVEGYKGDNGRYPGSEDDLTGYDPPYYENSYNNREISGYIYSLEFDSKGYKVTAHPVECGKTGVKIFEARNNESISESHCE